MRASRRSLVRVGIASTVIAVALFLAAIWVSASDLQIRLFLTGFLFLVVGLATWGANEPYAS